MAGREVFRADGDLDGVAQELSRQLLNGGWPGGGEHECVPICPGLLSNGPEAPEWIQSGTNGALVYLEV